MSSTASIRKHPIHPMLIVFPVGLWIFSFICGLVALLGGGERWVTAATWTVGGGVIGAALAAIPGFVDLLTMNHGKARGVGLWHMALNLVAVALFLVSWVLYAAVGVGSGWILSLLGVATIAVSGWLGGEMVYVHGVGVTPAPSQYTEHRQEPPHQQRYAA